MDSNQGKLFIGGISLETSEDKLKDYFGNYGEVMHTVVMRDKITSRPRGFGFVVFSDPVVLDRVLQDKHTIDGKTVEAKRALSREAYGHVTAVVQEPNFSLKFQSFDDAYEYYVNYGRSMGFNVRKKYSHKKTSGVLCRQVYCCSKEGFKSEKRKETTYSRPATRTGCKTQIILALDNNDDMVKVVSFNNEHNHDLVNTSMKHMMKANKRIRGAQKAFSFNAESSKMSIKQTIDLMSTKVGGYENPRFVRNDYENNIQKEKRAKVMQGDVKAMLNYFREKKGGYSLGYSFFYTLQVNDNNKVTNMFWTDAQSIHDYQLFGDVVCFDTTYRTNELDRPFVPIVGVNHHKQTIIFGAAMLYEESTEAFKWLFESFLSVMYDKHPQTILTDQSVAMTKAIRETLPRTVHRLCVWHIYQNAVKHLSHVFNKRQFMQDFGNCLYDFEYEDEWLAAWEGMLDKYQLRENKWLKNLFELKEKWAAVYGRDAFTADMKNTQRSESLNADLKKYVKHNFDILQFLDNYDRVLIQRREAEREADIKMMQTSPVLMITSPMLLQAAQVYSPEVFKIFQKEFLNVIECLIDEVSEMEQSTVYKVTCFRRESYVTYDSSMNDVYCSCKKFSSTGILCCHVLKVLKEKHMVQIPTNYMLKRWTKEGRMLTTFNYTAKTGDERISDPIGSRYNSFMRSFLPIGLYASRHEKLFDYAMRAIEKLCANLHKMSVELYQTDSLTQSSQTQESRSVPMDKPYYPLPPATISDDTRVSNDYSYVGSYTKLLQDMEQSDSTPSNFNGSQSSVHFGY